MWYNPIMLFLLNSPLHGMLSGNMMALTCTGRKSGKAITLPVGYLRLDGRLATLSSRERTWWRNLRGGAPVTLHLQGQEVIGQAEVVEDEAAVAEALRAYLQQAPAMARYLNIPLDASGQPDPAALAQAAHERVVIYTHLPGGGIS
jgi:deazaflavin-dependent oxidoreductase (nitroreductase family)